MADRDIVRAAIQLLEIQTDTFRLLDLHNKLALLAVLGGLKAAFAYGLGEDSPEAAGVDRLEGFARDYGLQAHLLEQPLLWDETLTATSVPEWFSQAFLAMSREAQSPAVLWIVLDGRYSECLHTATTDEAVGRLLGYPECCVAAYEANHRFFFTEMYNAFRERYANSQKRILAALQNPEPWPDHPNPGMEATGRTFQKYPYVFHVACDVCLADDNSPTSRLNETYRGFASECGAAFYREMIAAIQEAKKMAGKDNDG